MSGTITVQQLLEHMAVSAERLGYKRPEHPSDDVFVSAISHDLYNSNSHFKGNRARTVDADEVNKILNAFEGKVGNRTSVDLEKLGQSVLEDLKDRNSDLGAKLFKSEQNDAEQGQKICKNAFMGAARELFPNIQEWEMENLETQLPDNIRSSKDVDRAVGNIDPNYYGDLDDVVDQFDRIKAAAIKSPQP